MNEERKVGWYWEVIFDCDEQDMDLFSCFLFENGASGIEEVSKSKSGIRMKVFFQGEDLPPERNLIPAVSNFGEKPLGVKLVSSQKKLIEDWQSNWKEYFKPLEIGHQFLVLPPWSEASTARKKIVIQPGMGFGTGYHESTKLALLLLEWVFKNQTIKSVLDVGSGSGILAIASLLLGADKVTAVDIDDITEAEIKKNLALSGLDQSKCRVLISEPSALEVPSSDLVVANIEAHILITLKNDLLRFTGPECLLLLSGILYENRSEFLTQFETEMQVIMGQKMGEWYAVLLKKI